MFGLVPNRFSTTPYPTTDLTTHTQSPHHPRTKVNRAPQACPVGAKGHNVISCDSFPCETNSTPRVFAAHLLKLPSLGPYCCGPGPCVAFRVLGLEPLLCRLMKKCGPSHKKKQRRPVGALAKHGQYLHNTPIYTNRRKRPPVVGTATGSFHGVTHSGLNLCCFRVPSGSTSIGTHSLEIQFVCKILDNTTC